ncbi:MAG: formate/nitrite transporter family protein [Pseudomonadota bacterium]
MQNYLQATISLLWHWRGKISLTQLLRNWVIVYLGNFTGSILTAIIMLFTHQFMFGKGSIGLNAFLNTATATYKLVS